MFFLGGEQCSLWEHKVGILLMNYQLCLVTSHAVQRLHQLSACQHAHLITSYLAIHLHEEQTQMSFHKFCWLWQLIKLVNLILILAKYSWVFESFQLYTGYLKLLCSVCQPTKFAKEVSIEMSFEQKDFSLKTTKNSLLKYSGQKLEF